MRFKDKSALVTGAARGQGAEHARRLVAEGARVALLDVLDDEGEALAAELGPAATYISADVGKEAAWIDAMARTERQAGGLDFLVNNAGIAQFDELAGTDVAAFERHHRVNELGVFLGMKHAAPMMARRGGGSIVNVSSLGGLRAGGADIAYVATKWAVRGMTKSAAKELGPAGIRVNSIHPGLVLTPMLGAITSELLKARERRVPLGRAGTPADISGLVLFLLSEEAGYITGAEIAIDGGLGL